MTENLAYSRCSTNEFPSPVESVILLALLKVEGERALGGSHLAGQEWLSVTFPVLLAGVYQSSRPLRSYPWSCHLGVPSLSLLTSLCPDESAALFGDKGRPFSNPAAMYIPELMRAGALLCMPTSVFESVLECSLFSTQGILSCPTLLSIGPA